MGLAIILPGMRWQVIRRGAKGKCYINSIFDFFFLVFDNVHKQGAAIKMLCLFGLPYPCNGCTRLGKVSLELHDFKEDLTFLT